MTSVTDPGIMASIPMAAQSRVHKDTPRRPPTTRAGAKRKEHVAVTARVPKILWVLPRAKRPSRTTPSPLRFFLVCPALFCGLVSASLEHTQGPQGFDIRRALETARVACQSYLGSGAFAENCAVDYDSSSSSYFKKPATLLLLLCAIGLCCINFRRCSGRGQAPRRFNFAVFMMALFSAASFMLLSALMPPGTSGGKSGPPTYGIPSSTGTGVVDPVYTVPATADFGQNILPNIVDPEAIDPQRVCPGYLASNIRNGDSGFSADLRLAGSACNVYGNDVHDLTLAVTFQADDRLHVQIQPRYISKENETWFILPEALVPRPSAEPDARGSSNNMDVSWSNDPSFSFTAKRKDTGDVLFTSKGRALVFEDQFIEFGSDLPPNYNLYGLGEVIHGFRLGNNLTRTMFAADVADDVDANIYGTHPIYLDTRYFVQESAGTFKYVENATDTSAHYISYTHGVFLHNAHAQEVLLRPSGITWRVLGGSIDLYFFAGPQAEDVIKSYQHSTIGLPAMQQYWTLGFHQCRWGYESWDVLQDVIDNFAKFEIPLETIWSDIDYMKGYRDFENDPVKYSYAQGVEFLAKLHANHQHWVPIVDSAIYAPNPDRAADAYPPYDRGMEANAFVMNPDGSTYYGAVWPGYTVFPDWVGAVLNGTGTIDWWIDELMLWSKMIDFDGIWIDMSEVASFCVGSCGTGNLTLNPVHPPFGLPGEPGSLVLDYPEGFEQTNASEFSSAASAMSSQAAQYEATALPAATITSFLRITPTPGLRNVNWPPYAINNSHGDLAVHALSPNATHHGGTAEYDFHNLFGHLILNATYQALLQVFENKRPFIIGRSTFAGSGKWAGHWGGDNLSRWAYMYFSIPQALSFSIFGIPMFGPDTCGFIGNSDYELCARWMQLSAFFPFYRNHNILGANSQEPYVWSSVIDSTKKAMHIRFLLLPYMYTLFAEANRDGDTVMRALAWEFPHEPWLANADRQFMLGSAVMVTPCLEQGMTTVNGVFPGTGHGEVWYDWYSLAAVEGVKPGQNVTIDAPLGHIPVYLRGGNVIPVQEPGMTTAASRKNPWGLIAVLDKTGRAEGKLYLDDGESLVPKATWVKFSATATSVSIVPAGKYVDANPLGNVTVLGLQSRPTKIVLGRDVLDPSLWTYSETGKYLLLEGLEKKFPAGAWSSSWSITWS